MLQNEMTTGCYIVSYGAIQSYKTLCTLLSYPQKKRYGKRLILFYFLQNMNSSPEKNCFRSTNSTSLDEGDGSNTLNIYVQFSAFRVYQNF